MGYGIVSSGLPKFPQDSTLEELLEGVTDPDVIEFIKSDYEIRKAGLHGLFYKLREDIIDAKSSTATHEDFVQKLDNGISSVLFELTNGRIHDCRFIVQEYVGDIVKVDSDSCDMVENTRPVSNAVLAYWDLVNS